MKGDRYDFRINKQLPNGITFNNESGEISGKVENEISKSEYIIECKNIRSKMEFKLSLEFNISFTKEYGNGEISISENGKLMTNIGDNWCHCYLNLKIESGIYHVKYKFIQSSSYDSMMIGLSETNNYCGRNIYSQKGTCDYYATNGKSGIVDCHMGSLVTPNPNITNHGNGSIYELIINMKFGEFSICHNNSFPVLLVRNLQPPLYLFSRLSGKNQSLELISVVHID